MSQSKPLTPLQIETLRAIAAGAVEQKNVGYAAYRTVGADPTAVGRLMSMKLARWTKVIGGKAELTSAGADALAKAEGTP